jgi:hypothetical protein
MLNQIQTESHTVNRELGRVEEPFFDNCFVLALTTWNRKTCNCSFEGRVHDLGRCTKDGSLQRSADIVALEAELGSPKRDWPPKVTGLRSRLVFKILPAKRSLRPPMIFGALRLVFYGSMTSGDVIRRITSALASLLISEDGVPSAVDLIRLSAKQPNFLRSRG